VTASDQTKTYGDATFDLGSTAFTVTGLLNTDSVDSVTLTSPGEAVTANVGDYDIAASDAVGSGLGNYVITFGTGTLTVDPAALVITASDQTKTYGQAFDLGSTAFTVTGLVNADSVDSVTLASAGTAATAVVAGSPYDIVASDAAGSGLSNYTISFVDGGLTVNPASLVITAGDATKAFGSAFDLGSVDFTAVGLVNGDSVDFVDFASAGAEPSALEGDYAIVASNATGTGLVSGTVSNYDITYVDGTLSVVAVPPVNPPPPIIPGPPNPSDNVDIVLNIPEGGSVAVAPPESPSPEVADAIEVRDEVIDVSNELQLEVAACRQREDQVQDYLACIAEALDKYASALDKLTDDLPSSLASVSAIIQTARQGIDDARARAEARLATATTEAERQAIQRDALNEARGSLQTAQSEIRKAIGLIRADDPDLARVQVETGNAILAAVESVDGELARAVGL
jgi:hypothetical protein